MVRQAPQGRGWATVALLGVISSLALLAATLLARPDLSLVRNSMSYYAIGPWGILQSAGFVAMGLTSLALALALLRSGIASRWLAPASQMLMISGVASLGLVWYPMGVPSPSTMLGDAHQTAGTIGGVAQLGAALAFALAIRRDPAWQGWFAPALAAFAAAVIGALLTQVAIWRPELNLPMGATMRLVVYLLLFLWGGVAFHLRRGRVAEVSQPSGAP